MGMNSLLYSYIYILFILLSTLLCKYVIVFDNVVDLYISYCFYYIFSYLLLYCISLVIKKKYSAHGTFVEICIFYSSSFATRLQHSRLMPFKVADTAN